jgi:hypothetical protein
LELRGWARQRQNLRVHTKEFGRKGYILHARKDDPRYEIKSDKTDHVAFHKGSALTLSRTERTIEH